MSVGGINPATPGRTIAFPGDRPPPTPDRSFPPIGGATAPDGPDPQQRAHDTTAAADRARTERVEADKAEVERKDLREEAVSKPPPLPPLKSLTVAEIRAMLGIAPVLPKQRADGTPEPVPSGPTPIPAAALDRYRSEEIR